MTCKTKEQITTEEFSKVVIISQEILGYQTIWNLSEDIALQVVRDSMVN